MFSTNKTILNKSFCFSKLCLLFFIIFSFSTGCKSVKLPENVSKPLDYTDDDVVKNEIKNIYAMLETLPVKALWRACILGDAEVKEKCQEAVKNQGKTTFSTPYVDANTGELCVAISQAVYNSKGQLNGVIGCDILL